MKRGDSPCPGKGIGPKRFRLRSLLGAAVLVGVTLTATGILYRAFHQDRIRDAMETLEAVSRLKVAQVVEWRTRLLGDIQANATGRFGLLFEEAARQGFDSESLERMRRRMEERQGYVRYRDQVLLDARGELILRLRKDLQGVSEESRDLARRVLAQRRPLLGEPRLGRLGDAILEAATWIPGQDGEPLGVLIHQEDLDRLLNPLMETWLLPSRTAQSLVVTTEGSDAVVLNRLRGLPVSPLSVRIPLSDQEDLRVRAVRGSRGFIQGAGWNEGRRVLGYVQPIPDVAWVLLSVVDQEEVEAETRGWAWFALALMGMLVIASLVVWRMVWHPVPLREDAVAWEQLRHLTEGALVQIAWDGDGIAVVDREGRLVRMNLFAERLVGWTWEEARGRRFGEVFPLMDELSGTDFTAMIEAGMQNGGRSDWSGVGRLVRRDGTLVPVHGRMAQMIGEKGEVLGAILVFRDRTRERECQQRLGELEIRYRVALEGESQGALILGPAGEVLDANASGWAILGAAGGEAPLGSWPGLVTPEDRTVVERLLERFFAGCGEPLEADLHYPASGGGRTAYRHLLCGVRDAEDRLVGIRVEMSPLP